MSDLDRPWSGLDSIDLVKSWLPATQHQFLQPLDMSCIQARDAKVRLAAGLSGCLFPAICVVYLCTGSCLDRQLRAGQQTPPGHWPSEKVGQLGSE
jgi:hypothetical protein